MIGIYKITNTVNGKMYIGQSIFVEGRINQHKSSYNHQREYDKPLYRAILKYGLSSFTFEIIEQCAAEDLDEREKYWIKYYNSTVNGYNILCGGDGHRGENHPGHKLTENDVIDIRTRYNNRERKMEVYELYKDRIGESGFGKIWKGETWKDIMPEVYTDENKDFHKHNCSMKGSRNGRTKLTEEDVYNIRLRRKNGEQLSIVYLDYKDKLTLGSFTNVWSYRNWKDIVV